MDARQPLCPEIHGCSGLSPVRNKLGGAKRIPSDSDVVTQPTDGEDTPSETFPRSNKEPLDAKAPVAMFDAIKRTFLARCLGEKNALGGSRS